jgi:hypothetical protein
MFDLEADLAMQSLSRVNPSARISLGLADTMPQRPALAAKVAQCISEFSNIETMLPVLLAFLLSADAQTALAMFGSLENRAAQLRLLNTAAEEILDEDRFDCWTVLLAKFIKPTMKERDRFAHWSWGYSVDLRDALLLAKPIEKARAQWEATTPPKTAQIARDKVYVFTAADFDRTISRLNDTAELLEAFLKSVWPEPSPSERDRYHQALCNEPRFHGLLLAHKGQKSGQQSQPLSQSPDRNG